MKFLVSLFSILILLFSAVYEQQNNFIIGVVSDKNTNEPIPFASIYFKGEHSGVISNENGTFRLQINNFKGSNLIIKCIGYETTEVPITSIKLNEITRFFLTEKTYALSEVRIQGKKLRPPSAEKIVRNAIYNIPEFYPTQAFLLEGYYRDYIKVGNHYMNMYESLIELEDSGFLKSEYQNSKIKQVYGRINDKFPFDSLKVLNYSNKNIKRIPGGEMGFDGGNELSILRLADPIRNYDRNNFDFINHLKTDFLKNHNFRIKEITSIDGKHVYVIEFRYVKRIDANLEVGSVSSVTPFKNFYDPKAKADGLIYIERGNYMIKKLIYSLSLENKKYGKIKAWELNLEYKNFNGKPYLNYISYNNAFEIPNYSDSAYFFLKNLHVDKEYRKITLEFNNELNPEYEKFLGAFKISYKNEKINFKSIALDTVPENKNLLHFYMEDIEFVEKFEDFEPIMASSLNVKLSKNLTDINSNKINEYEAVFGFQYREFFVNRVNLDYQPLKPEECIDKWNSLLNYKSLEKNNSKEVLFNSPILYDNKLTTK